MRHLAPLLTVAAIIVLIFSIFKGGSLKVSAAGVIDDTPQTRKIFLLIFNPILESKGGVKLTQYFNWSDPDTITNQLISAFPTVSHSYLNYTIAERQEVDGYYIKQSGYAFTDDTFLTCMQNTSTCNSELIDYQKLFTDYNICSKNIDEVWIWGGPYFGYLEYNPVSYCGKTQFVMGFNYERQFDEAIHDFGHRMEFVANNRVGNGNWQQNELNDWNKYSLIAGHCGNVHYPPGSNVPADEYNYSKTTAVTTDCDGYLNYPSGPFTPTTITCSAWGCTQHGYLEWWLSHIPAATGTATSVDFKTIYNNWWKYYAFYDETATPLPSPSGTPQPTPTVTFTNLSSNLVPGRATFNFTYSGPSSVPFIVDMSITPDMSTGTYLTFAQGSASPIVETNPEKWDHYTCGRQFWWTVKNGYGVSAIAPATVVCPTPTPSPTIAPTPTPTPTPTPSPLSLNIYPSADSFVSRESGKTNTNFGSAISLQVDGSPVKTTYMKFDLTPLSGKTIANAVLWIKVTESSSSTQNIKQTSNSWTESGLTYNNKPSLSTKITSFSGGVSGTWKTVDLTNYVKTNKGKVVSFAVDSSGSDGLDFYSKEGTDKPYILVK